MRLLICAGMTGGGIYPALAVHQALENKTEATLWVGSENGLEESLLAPFNITYKSIPGSGIHGMGITKLPKNIGELIKGYRKAKRIIKDFEPDVIFYTGGYIGVPMAYASNKIASVVFIPDIEPGLALKIITKKAKRILISTDRSLEFFKNINNVTTTGYPLRKEIKQWSRKTGREYFGINQNEKILLVFGGSKGARSINESIIPNIENLTRHMHVIHITGTANWDENKMRVGKLNLSHPYKYHAYPFLHKEMGAAFAAADLAICRAGASIIGELPYFGLPAILVPYPYAWRYQYSNAEHLASHDSAIIIKDEKIKKELATHILHIIQDDNKLERMKNSMQSLAVQDAAGTIANIVYEIGKRASEGKIL